jgi:hypothetical protein
MFGLASYHVTSDICSRLLDTYLPLTLPSIHLTRFIKRDLIHTIYTSFREGHPSHTRLESDSIISSYTDVEVYLSISCHAMSRRDRFLGLNNLPGDEDDDEDSGERVSLDDLTPARLRRPVVPAPPPAQSEQPDAIQETIELPQDAWFGNIPPDVDQPAGGRPATYGNIEDNQLTYEVY